MNYHQEYQASIDNPEAFWLDKAQYLDWFTPPQTALSENTNGYPQWFKGGKLNTSYLALDHHVNAGRGDAAALIYDSPVTNTQETWTYNTLLNEVATLAGALTSLGVTKGDTVIVYMPMIPQAAVAMLAVARIGAIHSVVFGGFAASELAVRIDDAEPALIITASCGIEGKKLLPYKPMVDDAIALARHKPVGCVVYQRQQLNASLVDDFDHDWQALCNASEPVSCTPVDATDPLYILYTSGTTGKPKGVVRDNGGHAVALNYSMQAIYGIDQGDVFWAASDVGWVVGHSYIVYGPLIKGATTVMFEGKPVGTPDAGAFWRMVEQHKINVLFAAPTAFRAIRKEDPEANCIARYDLSSLRTIFMAGERLDPPTYHWTVEKTGKPVVDHWWQTETGWPICSNPIGIEALSTKPGSSSVPTPGFNVRVLAANGEPVATGEKGAIAISLPLPPGCLTTIWRDHKRFTQGYLQEFEGYYSTGDNGYIDEEGFVFIMGRTDDVINVAGHRLSTGEMEEVLASHNAVAECSVIGVADVLKGQIPVGLVLLKDGVQVDEAAFEQELIAKVRNTIGPVASFKRAVIVNRLPKTRSGKILRKLLRQIAADEPINIPSTIDDPASVTEIADLMKHKGLVER
ncbi:propionyl-CoA synthetase [Alteromonas stellipolaris]|uniref:propionyl-CoA synthetase n=1 Tax=Alteromonas TaxID=226 RepID=UPI00076FF85A|nr:MULTISPECIES: propionyl-CoA synthetase [Alteromonas]AMJ90417.1 propionate--CoA ligase [Alteromonas sp. Mac2]AMJ86556.1 propionate--CoA ligase [Alteromonas sp. Mac1]ANB22957.1 propionyl-CoA synthetase [Alteromonas stellipolaris]MDO6536670.1 propionyl-CoA synthetase [Alteromonas stellipolaris]MDO6539893.1 propionyl-CoA synthetase [Alteromonas stellipolaris]